MIYTHGNLLIVQNSVFSAYFLQKKVENIYGINNMVKTINQKNNCKIYFCTTLLWVFMDAKNVICNELEI